jgi:hypothetical protein
VLGLDGLGGESGVVWDVEGLENRGEVGEVGEFGGKGALLGDSYDVLINGGVGPSNVRIESPSSSEIPDNVERSE